MAMQLICRGTDRWQIVDNLRGRGLANSTRTADRRISQAKVQLRDHSDQEMEAHKAESVGVLREITRTMMGRRQVDWERDKDGVVIMDENGKPSIPKYKEPGAAEYRVVVQAVSTKAGITGEKIERIEISDPLEGVEADEAIKAAEDLRELRLGRSIKKPKSKKRIPRPVKGKSRAFKKR